MKNVWGLTRSILFVIVFYLVSAILFVVCLPLLLFPRKIVLWVPIIWTTLTPLLLKWIVGIKVNFKGLENLPKKNGYIVASKHQSAMETLLFHAIVPDLFVVLKRELMWIPVAGLYALRTGCIPIDRGGGAKTMRKMLGGVQKNLQQGMNLIIFPEGTRTKPGEKKPYAPGVALLYEQCKVPVVPVALNTGYVWPKNKIMKYPGTVTVEFLKPIEAGLPKRELLTELQNRIEAAQEKLPCPFGEGKCN